MKPTILLVEDNSESRYLFNFILTRQGCEVLQATNGVEALKLVADRLPDLVVMDIQMPEMDGYETVCHMRKDTRLMQTPIIGLSAYAMSSDREKAFACGFTGYIEKPIELDTFIKELSSYLPALVPV